MKKRMSDIVKKAQERRVKLLKSFDAKKRKNPDLTYAEFSEGCNLTPERVGQLLNRAKKEALQAA